MLRLRTMRPSQTSVRAALGHSTTTTRNLSSSNSTQFEYSSYVKGTREIGHRKAPTTRLSVEGPIYVGFDGIRLLNLPHLNKGSGFPLNERRDFGLSGLLPAAEATLEEQVDRAYSQFKKCGTPLAKNGFCTSLKFQNEVLYYALLLKHVKEVFPIIYTPTQGEAIEQYSRLFRRPEGCFLDITSPFDVEERLGAFGDHDDIDYIVVTDSEGILGIGDQGVGGIGISIAKLALMTLCAGVNPSRVIPVVLDTGTNNQELLHDPLYLGRRMPRVRGKQYDDFVDNFVQSARRLYPKAVIHFEDFGLTNAHKILDRYKPEIPCFNDDIQGTGAVTLASITAALKVLDKKITDTRILIFGAGSAGMGIAEQVYDNLIAQGLDDKTARHNIFLMDRPGLLTTALSDDQMSDVQKPFAKDKAQYEGVDTKTLEHVVAAVKPHILIGCSTQPGAFNEGVVKEMLKHTPRPIILPLSNPTRLHEAVPADLYKWTDGKALVATGSPFDAVNGKETSENNNCFVFPGIGLGAILSRSKLITNTMIAAAIECLAEQAPILKNHDEGVLPDVALIQSISARVATAVVLQAKAEGLATVEEEYKPGTKEHVQIPDNFDECLAWVETQMWRPVYRPLIHVREYQ
ncbi:NAD-dependent malic enzyme [Yarrowia sp. C11]|nr:NAD-dependent malic enzyme [Yarrowia sp. C11]KAG5370754.1 NAD-dependent malic enzyme [Yarrowia sp. E02]